MAQVGKLARFNSLRNLSVAELTTDTAASTAYGTAISLGVKSELTWSPQFVTEDLRGARGVVDSDQFVDFVNWSLRHGELNLDVWALAFGSAVVADATVSASKQLLALENGLTRKYIGIIGQPVTIAGGPADFYVCLLKCQVENLNPGRMGAGGWAEFEMSGRGFYTLKDNTLFSVATLEAKTDLTFSVALTDLATFLAG